MKQSKLPGIFGLLAVLGFLLRRAVYAGAVDEKNLIVSGHPALIALWVLTAAVLALAVFAGRKQADCKPGGTKDVSFLGHGILAAGLLLAVFLNPIATPGVLGFLWKSLAVLSAVCLLPAGISRLRGTVPFFALYAAPALFFVVNVVAHYQSWCANPQFTDYSFALLGSVMLALHSYQLAAASLQEESRPVLVSSALAAVFLCAAAMPRSAYAYLYLGGAVFCLTSVKE